MTATRHHAADPRTIFFHTPKTAGQSLINLISREYRGRVMDTSAAPLTRESWKRFTQRVAALPAEELRGNRALTGRMKFGAHELFPGPSRYLTFMRDPVKRFVSFYDMTKRLAMISPEHEFDLARPDWNRPEESWFTREIDNGQTRALADADWDLPFGGCHEGHFQAALANLERYFVFTGLTEQFDLSLLMLGRVCGWRLHFYVAKNVAPRRDAREVISPAVRGAITDLNSFDRRLYATLASVLRSTCALEVRDCR